MKDLKTMTFEELAVARRDANDKLGDLYSKAANRELTNEEKMEEINITRELRQIDEQMKTEFVSALQPAFGALAEMEIRPAQIPAKANELKKAMNDALQTEWAENRGLSIAKIALNPITLNPEDMKKIQEMEDSMSYGSNAAMMAGRMATATANAMETAAGNSAGAMTGFMGMGMAGGAMGGGFNAAQQLADELERRVQGG